MQGSGYDPNNDNCTTFLFGGQWMNFALHFPQIVWAAYSGKNRKIQVADIFFNDTDDANSPYLRPNSQKIFAGLTNTQGYIRGDVFQTKFINVPKGELVKLNDIKYKGINITLWNKGQMPDFPEIDNPPQISTTPFMYRIPVDKGESNYTESATDYYYGEYTGKIVGEKPTAYIFKGMYDNDCVKLLFDQNIL